MDVSSDLTVEHFRRMKYLMGCQFIEPKMFVCPNCGQVGQPYIQHRLGCPLRQIRSGPRDRKDAT